jgi:hypothetical protein
MSVTVSVAMAVHMARDMPPNREKCSAGMITVVMWGRRSASTSARNAAPSREAGTSVCFGVHIGQHEAGLVRERA